MTQNLEAERAVLGAMMTAPNVIDDLTGILSGGDFAEPRHEAIWDAILTLHREGRRPDVVLVGKTLGQDLNRAGGPIYLTDLTSIEVAPTPASAPHYANAVADAAIARRLIAAAISIRDRVEKADDIRAAAEDARRTIDEASAQVGNAGAGIGAADLLSETIDALDSDHDPGIQTGWADLDQYVNGLRPGQLVIIGARPSVGKSVIAANLAAHACKAGVGVHFASLEMTRREVMQRMLAAHATVDLGRLINHHLDEGDWTRIGRKSPEVSAWPLWVDDAQSQSLLQLRSRARTTARRLPLGLIVVDYLQLMAPRDRRAPREQQVGELSEGLKGLAKELALPVVALAQVNRGSADRTDKRPLMSDLRESGRIEADADHVWLLHRQDLVDRESTTGDIEVLVAKNRNGVAGAAATLQFQGHYSRAVQKAWTPTGAIA
jgi:replicative DNA helicase